MQLFNCTTSTTEIRTNVIFRSVQNTGRRYVSNELMKIIGINGIIDLDNVRE